jgi:hypothetical protein
MIKPTEHRDQPKNLCACGREKKVMAKYSIYCSNIINKLRSNPYNKESQELLKQILEQH